MEVESVAIESEEELKAALETESDRLSDLVNGIYDEASNSLNTAFSKKQVELISGIAGMFARNLILEFNRLDAHHPSDQTVQSPCDSQPHEGVEVQDPSDHPIGSQPQASFDAVD